MPQLPYSFTIAPVSPQRFAEILAMNGAGVTVSEKDANSGSVTTPDVSFDYSYDGSSSVTMTLTATHSFLARHASDATIEAHIRKLAS